MQTKVNVLTTSIDESSGLSNNLLISNKSHSVQNQFSKVRWYCTDPLQCQKTTNLWTISMYESTCLSHNLSMAIKSHYVDNHYSWGLESLTQPLQYHQNYQKKLWVDNQYLLAHLSLTQPLNDHQKSLCWQPPFTSLVVAYTTSPMPANVTVHTTPLGEAHTGEKTV